MLLLALLAPRAVAVLDERRMCKSIIKECVYCVRLAVCMVVWSRLSKALWCVHDAKGLRAHEATMKYESSTNRRLRNPLRAQELAAEAVQYVQGIADMSSANGVGGGTCSTPRPSNAYRVVLGLGPGRSGTKSLTELLAGQTTCLHAEHEMVVKRRYRRDESGRIDPTSSMHAIEQEEDQTRSSDATCTLSGSEKDTNSCSGDNANLIDRKDAEQNNKSKKKKKGSWGSNRRLEWDVPRLVRGAAPLTEQEEATWRVLRLLEQRHAFDEWVLYHSDHASMNVSTSEHKPRKLGARGWRKHNSGGEDDTAPTFNEVAGINDKQDDNIAGNGIESNDSSDHTPVVAAVSSVGLAYVHEYIALDPTVRIVVLMRPREQVVESFLKKSRGRNHWQKYDRRRRSQGDEQTETVDEYVQPDKTWDSAFPNMSVDECWSFVSAVCDNDNGGAAAHADVNGDSTWKADKACAIRAYWELYNGIVLGLCEQYPSNVRVFDMQCALNDPLIQEDLLRFCGFDEPVLDTSSEVHLNKKKI